MKAGGLVQGRMGWSHPGWKNSLLELIISEIQNRLEREMNKAEITELKVNQNKWDSYVSEPADEIFKYMNVFLNVSAAVTV